MSHDLPAGIAPVLTHIEKIGRYTDYLWAHAKEDLSDLPALPRPRKKAERERWIRAVRRSIAKHANRAQALAVMLIRLRGAVIEGGKAAETLANQIKRAARSSSVYEATARRMASGMCYNSKPAESIRSRRIAEALAQPVLSDETIEAIRTATDTLKQWADLCADLDALHDAIEPKMALDWNCLKEYPNDAIPFNTRRACSLIMAIRDGDSTTTQPTEHRIFGLTCGVIPAIQRVDFRAAETYRKPPSIKEGRELWRKRDYGRTVSRYGSQDVREQCRLEFVRRFNESKALNPPAWLRDNVTYMGGALQPGRLRQLGGIRWGRVGDAIGQKMCAKITGAEEYSANVKMVILDRPQHITGDDYACRAGWFSSDGWSNGWILLRRNWPSSIHVTELPAPAAISAQLDQASAYYFRNRREAELAKLSARQRLARLVRSARAVERFTVADSYAVGNCVPGTSAWIAQLGLSPTTPEVSGRELAKRWRAARYPQPDRFGSVVMHLAAKLPQPPAPPVNDLISATDAALSAALARVMG